MQVVYLFLSQKSYSASTFHLCHGMMLSIMCKQLFSLSLLKQFIFLIFLFFRFRLWDYLYFLYLYCCFCFSYIFSFSVNLYTYNFSISRMWLIKTSLFWKMESLLVKSRIPKMTVCGVKVGKIKLFWKHGTRSDRKHLTKSHL